MSQKKGDGGFAVKDRRPGFAIIDNALIDDYGPTIGAYGIAAYCILVRFAKADGTDAYPSYQTVADLMNTSRSTAIRAIKKLTQLGLIEKESRRSKGESLSNIYVLVDIKRMRVSQVVGSVPQQPPSVPQRLPSVSQQLGSVPGTPDQDTNNKTPITRVRAFESERARAATPTPPPATPPAVNGSAKTPRLPNADYEMPTIVVTPKRGRPKADTLSPHVKGAKFTESHLVEPGTGTNPVAAFYEFYSIYEHRLSARVEDDLPKAVTDLTLWRQVVTAWQQCDHKPTNIKGMLDWYRDPARIPGSQPNGQPNGKPAPRTADLSYKEWLLQTYGTTITAMIKPESELQHEYKQWRLNQGLSPGI